MDSLRLDDFDDIEDMSRDGNNLIIAMAGGGSVTIEGHFAATPIETLIDRSGEDAEYLLRQDLFGTASDEIIVGTDAGDSLSGLGGRNIIFGGGGNDVFEDGSGHDELFGGSGDDSFFANGSSDNSFDGGDGFDVVVYSNVSVSASLASGSGTDGETFFDHYTSIEGLQGGDGDDTLTGDGGDNTLFGGGGNDTLIGGAGFDRLDGGSGDDTLTGGAGPDVFGFAIGEGYGFNTITDFAAEDSIILHNVSLGNVSQQSGLGEFQGDKFFVSVNNEAIFDINIDNLDGAFYSLTPDGPNVIIRHTPGTAGDDNLVGNNGDQVVDGLGGNDVIDGGGGSDHLSGGEGSDTLYGGGGFNTLNGGAGNDTFIFDGASEYDVIGDFDIGDQIIIRDVDVEQVGVSPHGGEFGDLLFVTFGGEGGGGYSIEIANIDGGGYSVATDENNPANVIVTLTPS